MVILRGDNPQDRMSAMGHKRTFRSFRPMSALPPKADIRIAPSAVSVMQLATPKLITLSSLPDDLSVARQTAPLPRKTSGVKIQVAREFLRFRPNATR